MSPVDRIGRSLNFSDYPVERIAEILKQKLRS
jgi:hypothetical protein